MFDAYDALAIWTFRYYDPEYDIEYSCPVTQEFKDDAIARGIALESDFEPRHMPRSLTPEGRALLLDAIGFNPAPYKGRF